MPIKDLSDAVRLPRLGKIHLGTRHPEKGYPMKADHFVFPKDHPDYDKLVEMFGQEPKQLKVLIPVEDEEAWASQYYKSYNQTYGLVCKGDGVTAMRMIDIKTRKLPVSNAVGTVSLEEMPCLGTDCPEYKEKKCKEVMNLRFILPEIPGLGVWQIDTGSKNSILNINSCAEIIKRAFGRISMIPLNLTFEPIQVNNPETGKKQTVYTLNLRTDVTMAKLAEAARESSKTFLLEAPNLEEAFELEVEKDLELWGDASEKGEPVQSEAKVEPKPVRKVAAAEKKKTPAPAPAKAKARDPNDLPPELEPRVLKKNENDDMIPVEEQEPEVTTPDETPVTSEQIQELNELLKKAGMNNEDLGRICRDYGWEVSYKKDLKKWQFDALMECIGKALGV